MSNLLRSPLITIWSQDRQCKRELMDSPESHCAIIALGIQMMRVTEIAWQIVAETYL